MSGFEPRLDALPTPQRTLWPRLAPSVKLGFVLYGGTATVLRLGHRTSVDFDFFSENSMDPAELNQEFEFIRESTVVQQQKDTFSVLAPSQGSHVKISFFGGISIGRVGIPDLTRDGVIRIASLDDLLATKLKVLLQRVESKDYRDIVAILRSGVKLETGLAAAASMYSPNFQPAEAIKALTYFEGGDLVSLAASDRDYLTRTAGKVKSIPVLRIISRSLS